MNRSRDPIFLKTICCVKMNHKNGKKHLNISKIAKFYILLCNFIYGRNGIQFNICMIEIFFEICMGIVYDGLKTKQKSLCHVLLAEFMFIFSYNEVIVE